MKIQKANINDLDQVAELFDAYRVFYKQGSDLELANKFIADRINNGESYILVAVNDNNEFLGFTQLYPTFSSVSAQRTWVLNDLFVKPSARRLGVARKLMMAAKEHADNTSSKSIGLQTANDNVNAQALYESLGYKRDEEYYSYFLSL